MVEARLLIYNIKHYKRAISVWFLSHFMSSPSSSKARWAWPWVSEYQVAKGSSPLRACKEVHSCLFDTGLTKVEFRREANRVHEVPHRASGMYFFKKGKSWLIKLFFAHLSTIICHFLLASPSSALVKGGASTVVRNIVKAPLTKGRSVHVRIFIVFGFRHSLKYSTCSMRAL